MLTTLKDRSKRVVSLFLAILMLVGMLPIDLVMAERQNNSRAVGQNIEPFINVLHEVRLNSEADNECARDMTGTLELNWPESEKFYDVVFIQDLSYHFDDLATTAIKNMLKKIVSEDLNLGKDIDGTSPKDRVLIQTFQNADAQPRVEDSGDKQRVAWMHNTDYNYTTNNTDLLTDEESVIRQIDSAELISPADNNQEYTATLDGVLKARENYNSAITEGSNVYNHVYNQASYQLNVGGMNFSRQRETIYVLITANPPNAVSWNVVKDHPVIKADLNLRERDLPTSNESDLSESEVYAFYRRGIHPKEGWAHYANTHEPFTSLMQGLQDIGISMRQTGGIDANGLGRPATFIPAFYDDGTLDDGGIIGLFIARGYNKTWTGESDNIEVGVVGYLRDKVYTAFGAIAGEPLYNVMNANDEGLNREQRLADLENKLRSAIQEAVRPETLTENSPEDNISIVASRGVTITDFTLYKKAEDGTDVWTRTLPGAKTESTDKIIFIDMQDMEPGRYMVEYDLMETGFRGKDYIPSTVSMTFEGVTKELPESMLSTIRANTKQDCTPNVRKGVALNQNDPAAGILILDKQRDPFFYTVTYTFTDVVEDYSKMEIRDVLDERLELISADLLREDIENEIVASTNPTGNMGRIQVGTTAGGNTQITYVLPKTQDSETETENYKSYVGVDYTLSLQVKLKEDITETDIDLMRQRDSEGYLGVPNIAELIIDDTIRVESNEARAVPPELEAVPQVRKTVETERSNGYGKREELGTTHEVFTYRLEMTMPEDTTGFNKLTIEDQLAAVIDVVNSEDEAAVAGDVTIQYGDLNAAGELDNPANIAMEPDSNQLAIVMPSEANNNKLKIDIHRITANGLGTGHLNDMGGKTLRIEYNAKIREGVEDLTAYYNEDTRVFEVPNTVVTRVNDRGEHSRDTAIVEPPILRINVMKTGVSETPLSGAQFTLTPEGGGQTLVFETDETGLLTAEGLVPGTTYHVEETKAPTGYQKPETTWEVIVAGNGSSADVYRITGEVKELLKTVTNENIDSSTFPLSNEEPTLPEVEKFIFDPSAGETGEYKKFEIDDPENPTNAEMYKIPSIDDTLKYRVAVTFPDNFSNGVTEVVIVDEVCPHLLPRRNTVNVNFAEAGEVIRPSGSFRFKGSTIEFLKTRDFEELDGKTVYFEFEADVNKNSQDLFGENEGKIKNTAYVQLNGKETLKKKSNPVWAQVTQGQVTIKKWIQEDVNDETTRRPLNTGETANFMLYKVTENGEHQSIDVYRVTGADDETETSLTIDNLDPGTYYFKETSSPLGYGNEIGELPSGRFTIDSTGGVVLAQGENIVDGAFDVVNMKVENPSIEKVVITESGDEKIKPGEVFTYHIDIYVPQNLPDETYVMEDDVPDILQIEHVEVQSNTIENEKEFTYDEALNSNNYLIRSFNNPNNITLRSPSSDALSGYGGRTIRVVIKARIKPNTNLLEGGLLPENGLIDNEATLRKTEEDEAYTVDSAQIRPTILRNVRFQKVVGTEPLNGVVFELHKYESPDQVIGEDDVPIRNALTGEHQRKVSQLVYEEDPDNPSSYQTVNGIVTFKNVPAGDYWLVEKGADDRYVLNYDKIHVIVENSTRPSSESGTVIFRSPDGVLLTDTDDGEENAKERQLWNNEIITVKGEKIWEDEDNKYNTRPNSIKINLVRTIKDDPQAAHDILISDYTLLNPELYGDDDTWSYEFTEYTDADNVTHPLLKYSPQSNREYEYYITETPVPGYRTEEKVIGPNGEINIKNILDTKPVTFKKVDGTFESDNAISDIKFELRNESGAVIESVKTNEEGIAEFTKVTDGRTYKVVEVQDEVGADIQRYFSNYMEFTMQVSNIGDKILTPALDQDGDGNYIVENYKLPKPVKRIKDGENYVENYHLKPEEEKVTFVIDVDMPATDEINKFLLFDRLPEEMSFDVDSERVYVINGDQTLSELTKGTDYNSFLSIGDRKRGNYEFTGDQLTAVSGKKLRFTFDAYVSINPEKNGRSEEVISLANRANVEVTTNTNEVFKEISNPATVSGDLYRLDILKEIEVEKGEFVRDERARNVTFKLYRRRGEWDSQNNPDNLEDVDLGEYTTDANGKIELFNLVRGTYRLVETRPPRGYQKAEDKTFELPSEALLRPDGVYEITIQNKLPEDPELDKKIVTGEAGLHDAIGSHDYYQMENRTDSFKYHIDVIMPNNVEAYDSITLQDTFRDVIDVDPTYKITITDKLATSDPEGSTNQDYNVHVVEEITLPIGESESAAYQNDVLTIGTTEVKIKSRMLDLMPTEGATNYNKFDFIVDDPDSLAYLKDKMIHFDFTTSLKSRFQNVENFANYYPPNGEIKNTAHLFVNGREVASDDAIMRPSDKFGVVIKKAVNVGDKMYPGYQASFEISQYQSGTETGPELPSKDFATTYITGVNGKFTLLTKLDPGKYKLVETLTPQAYVNDQGHIVAGKFHNDVDYYILEFGYNSDREKTVTLTPYKVENEEEIAGDAITLNDDDELVITNDMLTEITVEKVWNDNNNELHVRPDNVELTLKRKIIDGENETADDNFAITETVSRQEFPYAFRSTEEVPLEKYNNEGKPYTYYVEEDVSGIPYEATYSEPVETATGQKIVITNTMTTKNFVIEKVDEAEQPLAGAMFKIINITAPEYANISRDLTTGGNGRITIDYLAPDKTYSLEETKAPEGYDRDTTVYTIETDSDGIPTVTSPEGITLEMPADEADTYVLKVTNRVKTVHEPEKLIDGRETITLPEVNPNAQYQYTIKVPKTETPDITSYEIVDELDSHLSLVENTAEFKIGDTDVPINADTFVQDGQKLTFKLPEDYYGRISEQDITVSFDVKITTAPEQAVDITIDNTATVEIQREGAEEPITAKSAKASIIIGAIDDPPQNFNKTITNLESTTLNGETVYEMTDADETITYQVTLDVPQDVLGYQELTIKDTLPENLSLDRTSPKLVANGTDQTYSVSISEDGKTLFRTFDINDENFRFTEIAGKTLTLTYNAKLTSGETAVNDAFMELSRVGIAEPDTLASSVKVTAPTKPTINKLLKFPAKPGDEYEVEKNLKDAEVNDTPTYRIEVYVPQNVKNIESLIIEDPVEKLTKVEEYEITAEGVDSTVDLRDRASVYDNTFNLPIRDKLTLEKYKGKTIVITLYTEADTTASQEEALENGNGDIINVANLKVTYGDGTGDTQVEEYQAKTTIKVDNVSLQVTKEIDGEWPRDGKFEFILQRSWAGQWIDIEEFAIDEAHNPVTLPYLLRGSYRIVETSAPEGYVPIETEPFELGESIATDGIVRKTLINRKHTIDKTVNQEVFESLEDKYNYTINVPLPTLDGINSIKVTDDLRLPLIIDFSEGERAKIQLVKVVDGVETVVKTFNNSGESEEFNVIYDETTRGFEFKDEKFTAFKAIYDEAQEANAELILRMSYRTKFREGASITDEIMATGGIPNTAELFMNDTLIDTSTATVQVKTGEVRVIKTAEGENLPSGTAASFKLYRQLGTEPNAANDTEVGMYQTSKTTVGNETRDAFTVDGLLPGTYYFVETEAPAGYLLDETEHSFTLTVNDQGDIETAEIRVDNKSFEIPTPEKLVTEGNSSYTKEKTLSDLNAIFTYKVKVPVTKVDGWTEFTLTDSVDKELTVINNDASKPTVTINGTTYKLGEALSDDEGDYGKFEMNNNMITFEYTRLDKVIALLGETVILTFDAQITNLATFLENYPDGKVANTAKLKVGSLEQESNEVLVSVPKTSVTLTKTIDDGQPLPQGVTATFDLYKVVRNKDTTENEETDDERIAEGLVTENGIITVNNLSTGDYYFRETTPPTGYQEATDTAFTIGADSSNPRVTVDNKPLTTSVTVTKSWEGGPEIKPTITVQLFREAEGLNKEFVGNAIELENGQTEHTWDNLPTHSPDGKPYTYTVDELNVPEGYGKQVSRNADQGFTITNTYNVDTTDITAYKKWVGGPIEKPDVEFTLYRSTDGTTSGAADQIVKDEQNQPYTANLAGGENYQISHTWTGLDVTDNSGNAYTYYVKETKIGETPLVDEMTTAENYAKVEEDLVVTNTYANTEVIDVYAKKEWSGGPVSTHVAPTFELYQNGTKVTDKTPVIAKVENTQTEYTVVWNDLDKVDDFGQAYIYTVVETGTYENYGKSGVTGTGTFDDPYTIINTYNSPTTTHTVTKTWDGGPSVHPVIEVQLKQDNVDYGQPVALVNGKTTYEWTDLPTTDDTGKGHVYTVEEISIAGESVTDNQAANYTVETVNNDTTSTITNTYASPTINVSGQKTWVGDNESDRPESITVELLRGGEPMNPAVTTQVTSNNEGNWTYSFDVPATDADGNAYTYAVKEYHGEADNLQEGAPAGYEVSYDGMNITNTYVGTTSLDITKNWVDDNNSANTRPEEITLRAVQYKGETATGKTFDKVFDVDNATNEKTYTIENLPKYDVSDNNAAYTYKADEVNVPGYEKNVDNNTNTITNTLSDTISIDVEKVWVGGSDRPAVTITLVKDGNATDQTVTLNSDNNWTSKFENQPRYENGKAIVYTVKENSVDGYTTSITGDMNTGFTVTNTYDVQKDITVKVEKVWEGGSVESHNAVQVQLFRIPEGGNKEFVGEPITLDGTVDDIETAAWKYEWTGLAKTDQDGNVYTYSVDELNVPEGYSKDVSNRKDGENQPITNDFIITNTYGSAKTDITAYKRWIGGPIEKPDVEFTLYRSTDGTTSGADDQIVKDEQNQLYTANLAGGENYQISHTWTGLDVTDNSGNAYTYYVKETKIGETPLADEMTTAENYEKVEEDLVVTNTYANTEVIDVYAKKEWSGGSVSTHVKPTFALYRNGVKVEGVTPKVEPESGTSEIFTYEWTGLPKVDDFGQDYTYTVVEMGTYEDYGKSGVTGTGTFDDPYTIINTYNSPTTHSFVKTWEGGPTEKPTITVQLKQGTEDYGDAVTLEDGTVFHEWENLPTTNPENGETYIYTVEEISIGTDSVANGTAGDYNVTTTTDGTVTNIVNTNTKKTSVEITKKWEGDNDNEGDTRPETIELKAIQEKEGTATGTVFKKSFAVTATEETYTIDNLPLYNTDGSEFSYKVDEVDVSGYTKSIDGTTITNTYDPGKIDITATKVWVGGDATQRPSVTLRLMAGSERAKDINGTEVQDISLSGTTWTGTFENLPRYENGTAIEYSVKELNNGTPIAEGGTYGDYTVSYSGNATKGFTVTNSYQSEEKTIQLTKEWKYQNNSPIPAENQEMDAVEVLILQNDAPYRIEKLKKSEGWNKTISVPEKSKEGESYTYTVREFPVEGYTSTITPTNTGFEITNKQDPSAEREFTIVKFWDGKEPENIEEVEVSIRRTVNGTDYEEIKVPDTDPEENYKILKSDGWILTLTGLPSADGQGNPYTYDVEELHVPGYTSRKEAVGTCGFAIHNVPTDAATLTIFKQDETTNIGLAGAKFILEGVTDSNYIQEVTSDEFGSAIFNSLPIGTYELKEIEAPEGYEMNSTVWNVEVKINDDKTKVVTLVNGEETDEPFVVTNERINGKVVLTKTFNGNAPNNDQSASFELYKGTELLETYTTDRDGKIEVENLETGSYYFKEVATALGYVLDETNHEFSIVGDLDEVHYLNVDNLIEEKSLTVTKKWVGGDENSRPQVTVTLYQELEGVKTPVGDSIILANYDSDGNLTYTWEGLPIIDQNGYQYTYTVEEAPMENYTEEITGDMTSGFIITNTYTPGKTSHTVEKTWEGGSARKPTIEVQLYRNDEALGQKVALTHGMTEYTWTGLDKTDNEGRTYVYTVKEVSIDGEPVSEDKAANYEVSYATEGTTTTITNKYTEALSVYVEKRWIGPEQASVTLKLEANGSSEGVKDRNGEIVQNLTLTESNNWKGSFDNLPRYDTEGEEIKYTVSEEPIAGYEATTSGKGTEEDPYVITNTIAENTKSIVVTKTWQDNSNSESTRPETVTFVAVQQKNEVATGESFSETFTVSRTENTEQFTVTGLPKYDSEDNIEYSYEIEEQPVENYTPEITGNETEGFTITNTYTPGKTSHTVNKVWEGGSTPRPTIVVQLYQGTEPYEEDTVTLADGTTTYTWTGLDSTDENGVAYEYTVREISVNGTNVEDGKVGNYTVSETTTGTTTTITNTYHSATQDVTATKVWENVPAESTKPTVWFKLQRAVGNQAPEDVPNTTIQELADGTIAVTWNDMPITDEYNRAYNYSVLEVDREGVEWTSDSYDKREDGLTVTNTYKETKTVNFTKVWVNGPTDKPAVTINLLANGELKDSKTLSANATDLTGSFDNLPIYENGEEINYTVTEDAIESYTTEITGNETEGFTITNTYTPDKTSHTVNKVWVDGPEEKPIIRVELQRKLTTEEDTAYVKVDEANITNPMLLENSTYTWTGLASTDGSGKAYSYRVVEISIDGEPVSEDKAANYEVSYATEGTTTTITNTYTEALSVYVEKRWIGPEQASVTLKLEANGSSEGVKDRNGEIVQNLTLTESNNWKGSFGNLPRYDTEGEEIKYTVSEEPIAGYEATTSGKGTEEDPYVITNTIAENTKSIAVTKTWQDNSNAESTRPETVTFVAVQQKNEVATGESFSETFTVSRTENTEQFTVTGLPKYDSEDNIEYSYEIEEQPVENYTPEITGNETEGFTITNTYTPGKTSHTVNKVWEGGPEEKPIIRVELQRKLTTEEDTAYVKVNEANITNPMLLENSTYTWTGLASTDGSGKAYSYRVVEISIDGEPVIEDKAANYEVSYDYDTTGLTKITNTYQVATDTVTATLSWQNGSTPRPTVYFKLYRQLAEGQLEPVDEPIEKLEDGTNEVSWRDMPQTDENGRPYTYAVKQVNASGEDYVPEGYTKVEDGLTVTNTLKQGETSYTVTKEWVGEETHPNVNVQLYQNEVAYAEKQLLTTEEPSHTWNNLPKLDSNGQPYTYTVKELDENGVALEEGRLNGNYRVSYDDTTQGTMKITNTYVSETVSHTVTKEWKKGPDEKPTIEVQLYQDDMAYGNVISLSDGTTTYEWDNLPRFNRFEEEYTYTVKEVTIDGVTIDKANYNVEEVTEGGNTIITNTFNNAMDINYMIVWQGSPRPDMTLNLMGNGNLSGSQDIEGNADGSDVTGIFEDVPILDDENNPIDYTLEVAIQGYVISITGNARDGFLITNVLEETIDIVAHKTWINANAEEQNAKFEIYIDDSSVSIEDLTGDEVVKELNGDGAVTWKNLPKYKDDVEIQYKVKEITEGLEDDYKVIIQGDREKGFVFTNVKKSVASLIIHKIDEDTREPLEGAEFELYRKVIENDNTDNSSEISRLATENSRTLTPEEELEKAFLEKMKTEIQSYEIMMEDSEVHEEITEGETHEDTPIDNEETEDDVEALEEETIEELDSPEEDYDSSVEEVPEDTAIEKIRSLILSLDEELTSSEVKRMTTGNPPELRITLVERFGEVEALEELLEAYEDEFILQQLEAIRDETDRRAMLQDIEERLEEFNTEEPETTNDNFGHKLLETLNSRNSKLDGYQKVDTQLTTGENGLTESILLEPGDYMLVEVIPPEGYMVEERYQEFTVTDEAVILELAVTNKEIVKTSVEVKKVWVGGEGSDSITVYLYADGVKVEEVRLSDSNDWQHTFTDLDVESDGQAIAYTVDEVTVPEGYTKAISGSASTGFVITNTKEDTPTSDKTTVNVKKVWVGGEGSDSITVYLYADGVKVEEVRLSDSNDWQHTFTDLDVESDGQAIDYTVDEVTIPEGYTKAISGSASAGFVITNTPIPTKDITINKVWSGEDAGEGIDKVIVQILADGLLRETVEIKASENWIKTIQDLPTKTATGKDIKYTVKEEALEGYTSTVEIDGNEFTITNTLISEEPEDPEDPIIPDHPETPEDPEDPIIPGDSEDSTSLDEPIVPIKPDEPIEPIEPDVPDTPVEPVQPVEPVTPDKPDQPTTDITEEPVDTPIAPVETPKTDNPRTYDEGVGIYRFLVIAAGIGIVGLQGYKFKLRWDKKKRKKGA